MLKKTIFGIIVWAITAPGPIVFPKEPPKELVIRDDLIYTSQRQKGCLQ